MTTETIIHRWVTTVSLQLPSLKNNTADAERLLEALASKIGGRPVHADLHLIDQLPGLLRQTGFRLRVVLFEDRGRWLLLGDRGCLPLY